MMTAVAEVTDGREAVTEERGVLRAVLAAAQSLDLYAEISAEGRGAGIHHAIATQGSVSIKDFVSWICLEKKCSRVRVAGFTAPHRRARSSCYVVRLLRVANSHLFRLRLTALSRSIWPFGGYDDAR